MITTTIIRITTKLTKITVTKKITKMTVIKIKHGKEYQL